MSLLEIGGKPIPKTIEPLLIQVRDRVRQLERKYGSLSKWGRPIFYDVKEVATIYYLNEKIGVSLDRLASFLGLDKTGLYKLVRRIEQKGKVTYYDSNENATKVVNISANELIEIVEEMLGVASKQKIKDPFQSTIIRKYWQSKIPKRAKIAGKPAYLSERAKKRTLKIVRDIMNYIEQNRPNEPTNPDFWTEELVEEVLWDMYKEYPKVARAMIQLRTVPEWGKWFEGKIGAVTKRINPKMTALFYKDFLRLKQLWKEGKLSDSEMLMVWLHITTGAREGYTLYSGKVGLDSQEVKSSLVGLRWENLSKVGDTYILKIYESKTEKWWTCDLSWLDREMLDVLLRYAKDKGSIIKSITGCETVSEFVKYYQKLLKKVSKLLELPFKLVPHDLRRSHISILAELGVPMEYAISGHMDFGVGWEDAKTAVVFYLRFSKYTKQLIMKSIEERKKLLVQM